MTSKNKPSPDAPAADKVEFELSIEDTAAQHQRGLQVKGRKVPVIGYNPYDADTPAGVPSAKPVEPRRKPTDLRKLSEWIRLQRQVEELKQQRPDSDPDAD